jgi:hypothetical protein
MAEISEVAGLCVTNLAARGQFMCETATSEICRMACAEISEVAGLCVTNLAARGQFMCETATSEICRMACAEISEVAGLCVTNLAARGQFMCETATSEILPNLPASPCETATFDICRSRHCSADRFGRKDMFQLAGLAVHVILGCNEPIQR